MASIGGLRATIVLRMESGAFVRSVITRVLAANLVAAGIVFLFLELVEVQTPEEERPVVEYATFGIYILAAAAVGMRVITRAFEPVARWLDADRAPSDQELDATLDQPLVHARWVFIGWFAGGLAYALFHAIPNPVHHDLPYGLFLGAVAVLGGLAASMLSYLLVEYEFRPIFAAALQRTAPLRPRTLGVKQRVIAAWALGSGVIFIAIWLTTVAPARVGPIWFLALVGLGAGGIIITFAARSVARPVAAMRTALARVEEGDFDARVEVDDGGEVGLLQAGFNQMASGLAERERLRTVFGTYVDRDIAEHILTSGTSLAGEEVEITIMFVDVRDFTGFAERAPAIEVVATMNRLFELIVPIIHEHRGHVDKFVGDGVLAVFGAPRREENHAELAVRAAIDITRAVRREFGDELEVGIGVNTGTVIAGNVGGGGRLDFSVIGHAVNVAQRVEAATRTTGDAILISEETRVAVPAEVPLVQRSGVELKGGRRPVSLYAVENLSL